MKRQGILHGELSKIIAEIGHGQNIVIGDYGLPVPHGVRCIDLALKPYIPSFLDTLETILTEFTVESYIVAQELVDQNPALYAQIQDLINQPSKTVPHEEFKSLTKDALVMIRTGEWTPYANIILRSGVVF